MNVKVYSVEGKEVSTIALNDEVFAREVSEGSIYNAIKNELANLRVGTAATKRRDEVQGTTKKPWAQKGTGRARAGRVRSPLWVGGGIIFGPQPRDYSYVLPKKVKQLAMKSILTMKTSASALKVVQDFTVANGKTKDLEKILLNLVKKDEKTVLITHGDDELLKRAGRNIPYLKFLSYNRLRAHDLFYSKNLLVLEKAANSLNSFYSKDKEA